MIPRLSYFQWHPFSVSSAPHEDVVEFYIKDLGDWTGLLYEMAGKEGKAIEIVAYLDGPYGSHSIPIDSKDYQNILCLSGGIGITPLLSLIKEILHEVNEGRPLKNMCFIWIGKEVGLIKSVFKPEELHDELPEQKQQLLKTYCHISGQEASNQQFQILKSEEYPNIFYEKGRPNLDKYFSQARMNASIGFQTRVAVLVCGPQPLIDDAQQLAQKWSKGGVRFDVHQEVFLF